VGNLVLVSWHKDFPSIMAKEQLSRNFPPIITNGLGWDSNH